MNSLKSILKCATLFAALASLLSGCAGSQIRARKAEREKVSQNSHLYCDFVNGDLFPDVEVQLNIEMAKRCDHGAPLSITQYRTSNENMGVIYCCSLAVATTASAAGEPTRTVRTKSEAAKPPPAAPAAGDGLGD